ncbi:MAG TPA: TolC family protein [Cyclobacteriaceae bacterium]|nr:TolC family protein [Cyclobacteriaceae bacterium]HNA14670.1 TolC family protein [Cyclobacteriaceae bacterium]HNH60422.1 TolC family protein [Cyclobacteriaceae bacterium]
MLKTIIFGLCFLAAHISAQERASLDSLIQIALRDNLSLRASHEMIQVARSKVAQSVAWEPPQVGVEFYETPIRSFPIPTKGGMETDYFVQQSFPWPGKLPAKRKASESGARVTEANREVLSKNITLEIKTAYYELYSIQKRIEINIEQQTLIRSLIDVTLKQYEVGMGKASDVVRAQTELATLVEAHIDLVKEQTNASIMLNTILNRMPDESIGAIPEVDIQMPYWETGYLVELSKSHRDELAGMKFETEMNRHEVDAMKREGYPDIMVKTQYKNYRNTSRDFWSLMIGVSLPVAWWSRGNYTGKIQESRAQVNRAVIEIDRMKTTIGAEIAKEKIEMETAYHHSIYHRDVIIPQAKQVLDLTLADYQNGKTEFFMVMEAYKMYLMAKSDYAMNSAEFLIAKSRLERAVGLDEVAINQQMK